MYICDLRKVFASCYFLRADLFMHRFEESKIGRIMDNKIIRSGKLKIKFLKTLFMTHSEVFSTIKLYFELSSTKFITRTYLTTIADPWYFW